MTRFESIGVERQNNARNMEEAEKQMNNSCQYCVYRNFGHSLDCDHCAIVIAHERTMKTFMEGGFYLGLG